MDPLLPFQFSYGYILELTTRNASAFWKYNDIETLSFQLMPSRMPIPQPIQELQVTLYVLSVYLANVSLHFLSKENFMVHHLIPNLHRLNSPPYAPFLQTAC